ncbi:MAG: efflux RND transporter periplasmic adaptor subunit [Janthinobacterium lividum]
MSSTSRPLQLSAAALLILSTLAACGKKADPAAAGAAPPPPEVAVVTIAPKSLALVTELPGRLEASRVAQVRARAAGIVLKREFREGSDVKAGTTLFRIDPAPFKAAYESAQATVARSQASLAQAELKVKRYKPLVETNAISKQEYDDALTAQKAAAADLATSRAGSTNASLNLGYATVTAPISGRIGRALVTEGALVGQGEATPLAVVQQVDPIYVNMTQSSTDLLKLQRAMASGKLAGAGKNAAKVTLLTEDGRPYGHDGKLLFSDLTVDESSGAVTLRAEFPNPERQLLPGMYVRAQLSQAVDAAAITVPQQAVQRTPEGAFVLVVGADNKVASRTITADNAQGDDWIVTDGLKAGDRVIVEGVQKTKAGGTVKPIDWKGPAAKPAGAAGTTAGTAAGNPAAPAAGTPAAAADGSKSAAAPASSAPASPAPAATAGAAASAPASSSK